MALTAFERNLASPIEVSSFRQDKDKKARDRLARLITERLRRHGCFPMRRGEGVTHWVRGAMKSCAAFFSMPEDQKRLSRATTPGGPGYAGLGAEQLGEAGEAIWRESYTLPAYAGNGAVAGSQEGGRARAPLPPDFSENLEQLNYVVAEAAREVARAVAVGCDQNAYYFRNSVSTTRIFYYPEQAPGARHVFLPPHKDTGLLTFVIGPPARGLEFLDPETGCYAPAILPVDQILVVGGELLECVTAGYLKAATHRACFPGEEGRVAIVSFANLYSRSKIPQMFPDRANLYLEENPAYAQMTPQEFSTARLESLGYRVFGAGRA